MLILAIVNPVLFSNTTIPELEFLLLNWISPFLLAELALYVIPLGAEYVLSVYDDPVARKFFDVITSVTVLASAASTLLVFPPMAVAAPAISPKAATAPRLTSRGRFSFEYIELLLSAPDGARPVGKNEGEKAKKGPLGPKRPRTHASEACRFFLFPGFPHALSIERERERESSPARRFPHRIIPISVGKERMFAENRAIQFKEGKKRAKIDPERIGTLSL